MINQVITMSSDKENEKRFVSEFNTGVITRDSTRLSTLVHRIDTDTPMDTLVIRTPYSAIGMFEIVKLLKQELDYQVHYVLQDCRGRYNSDGEFDLLNEKFGKNQFLTYYFIAAHPGCDEKEMKELRDFTSRQLKVHPEQVQIFTPTPSTYASVMYYTEMNPFTMQPIFVEKSLQKKNRQKDILVKKVSGKK